MGQIYIVDLWGLLHLALLGTHPLLWTHPLHGYGRAHVAVTGPGACVQQAELYMFLLQPVNKNATLVVSSPLVRNFGLFLDEAESGKHCMRQLCLIDYEGPLWTHNIGWLRQH